MLSHLAIQTALYCLATTFSKERRYSVWHLYIDTSCNLNAGLSYSQRNIGNTWTVSEYGILYFALVSTVKSLISSVCDVLTVVAYHP